MTQPTIPRARCLVLALAALALGVSVASVRGAADDPPLPPPRPPELAEPEKAPPAAFPPAPRGRRGVNLSHQTDRGRRERRGRNGAAGVGRGMRDRRADPAVIDHGGRRRREPAGTAAGRLRVRRCACRVRSSHRRTAWPSDAAAEVAAIETGPGYDCRTQDRIAGAKISAHAKGLAVDFVAIALADKRRILVDRQAGAEETSYLRAIRTAACG